MLEDPQIFLTSNFFNFYMPGKADGISSQQYSPLSLMTFLYPNFSFIGFLPLLGPTSEFLTDSQGSLGLL